MAKKASMWAKAAGEYYRKNKGKNGIQSFSDVLKSSDFKQEYHTKYGKTMSKKDKKGKRSTKRHGGYASTTPVKLQGGADQIGNSTTAASDLPPANITEPAPTAAFTSAAQAPPPANLPVTGGKRKSKKRRTAKKSSY
jgi:hypothetical protein